MGKSNKIVPQSMCNWLLLVVFVMQFVVSLLVKNLWGIFTAESVQLHYYILFVEVFAVALPMFLLCVFNGSGFAKTFGSKKIKFPKAWRCFCLGLCLQPLAMILNIAWQTLLDIESTTDYNVASADAKGFVATFVFVCIVPAFCEELLLRGMYISAVKRKGYAFAIVSSTIMFVLLHSDVSMMVAHAILGIVTAIVVLGTKSVYSGVLVHLAFNLGGVIMDTVLGMNSLGICIAAGVAGLILSLMLLKKIVPGKSKKPKSADMAKNLLKALFNLPILIIIIIYIYRIVG